MVKVMSFPGKVQEKFSYLAARSVVNEAILEDKLVDLWPDYSCLYDVSSQNFKNRDGRNCGKVGRERYVFGDIIKRYYNTPGRHFECRALKSREHAMPFDWLID